MVTSGGGAVGNAAAAVKAAAGNKEATVAGQGAGGGAASVAKTPTDSETVDAAGAAMAAAYFNAKPPPYAGPTGFRMWKTEVSVWQRLTSLRPEARAATIVASLSGVAKRLALTMPEDDLFAATGVATLMALLESRFGGTHGTTSMAAYSGMRACVRGGMTMEEYLVAFDEAGSLCVEANCPLDDATMANVVLHQANLTDMERTMAIATATKSPNAIIKYVDMTATLLTLYGRKDKLKATSLVGTPVKPKKPRPARRGQAAAIAAVATDDGGHLCWYCNRGGHIKASCPMRERHQSECGKQPGQENKPAGGAKTEVIHMVILAGTTDAVWSDKVGQAIMDPGATATVVGAGWLDAFLAALPPHALSQVSTTSVSAMLQFGSGDPVEVTEQVVLPFQLGGVWWRLRAYVVPGRLPLLVSRQTLKSMGADLGISDDTVIIAGHGKGPLSVSAAGHLVFCALGGALSESVLAASCHDLPELQEDSDSDSDGAPDEEAYPRRHTGAGHTGGRAPAGGSPRGEPAGGSSSATPPPSRGGPGATATAAIEGTARTDAAAGRGPKGPLLTADTHNLPGVARKLHIQYSHASAHRLCTLLRTQGVKDAAVMKAVHAAAAACEVCRQHGGRPARAAVAMPTAGAFNDAVAVDLFFLEGNLAILHIIDKFSRFSMCFLLEKERRRWCAQPSYGGSSSLGLPTRRWGMGAPNSTTMCSASRVTALGLRWTPPRRRRSGATAYVNATTPSSSTPLQRCARRSRPLISSCSWTPPAWPSIA